MRQAFLPVSGKPLAVFGNGINVTGQGQRDDIGVQSVNDRAGLLARAAVGLLNGHILASFGFPMFGEGCVEFDI